MDNVAIILKPKVIKEFQNLIPNLVRWLHRRKKRTLFVEEEGDRLLKFFNNSFPKNLELIDKKNVFSDSDLVITLGGDGTLIGICREAGRTKTPVFGVNMGNLGFITEFSKANFYEDLSSYFSGSFTTKSVPLFKAEVKNRDGDQSFKGFFLNDAVVSKHNISRMFSLSLESENDHISNISGDGIIISSPLGSTAYSMAAGGPIVHPDLNGMLVTPICPHSLIQRPMVISDRMGIKVKLVKNSNHVILTLDGQEGVEITGDDIVHITKDKNRMIRIVENPERTFFNVLKEKFIRPSK